MVPLFQRNSAKLELYLPISHMQMGGIMGWRPEPVNPAISDFFKLRGDNMRKSATIYRWKQQNATEKINGRDYTIG